MGRATSKLSVKFVERKDLKPGLYGDGNGLYLQVSNRRTKAWVFRFMINLRPRKMGSRGRGGAVAGLEQPPRPATVPKQTLICL